MNTIEDFVSALKGKLPDDWKLECCEFDYGNDCGVSATTSDEKRTAYRIGFAAADRAMRDAAFMGPLAIVVANEMKYSVMVKRHLSEENIRHKDLDGSHDKP